MAVIEYFVNAEQIEKEIYKITETVIDNVSKTLLEDFQNHLNETIYYPRKQEASSSDYYMRYKENGGFYSGWEIEKANKYVRALIYNADNLISPSNDMINSQTSHGGIMGEDIRDILPEVLNDKRYNSYYSYNGGATYMYLESTQDGYWNSYMRTIDDKILKWLDKEFKKYGISRR